MSSKENINKEIADKKIRLQGKISKILFQENDFIIAKLKTTKSEVTILGTIYGINKGDYIEITEAEKEYHKTFGEQYRVIRWEKPIPISRESVIEFLCLIKNIGPVRAGNIVDALGTNALKRIMDEGPEILKPIPTIGSRAKQIHSSVLEQFELQLLVQKLSPMGLSLKHIIQVYKTLGAKGGELVKSNPYILIDCNISSFAKADAIALADGKEKKSPERIMAALKHVLIGELRAGHCYLPEALLVKKALKELGVINIEDIKKVLIIATGSRYLISDGDRIYLPTCYYAEAEIAQAVINFNKEMRTYKKIEPIISQYEEKTKTILAEKQKEAVRSVFTSGMLIITGGPGTGKTETIKAIVNAYEKAYPINKLALAAPTGRASRRLAELTQRDARTIHRLLEYKPGLGPEFGRNKPLQYDLIIIDEFSMVDIFLAKDLFRAISPDTRLVIVGDKDQLPPVGPGNLFRDLLEVNIPVIELDQVFRQAQESDIVLNSHLVNQGNLIKIRQEKTDFFYIKTNNDNQILNLTKSSVMRLIEKGYEIDQIQVLVPTRKDAVGVYNLNHILQKAVNPTNLEGMKYGNTTFYISDKVMQVENNYDKDVFNGDIGKITNIGPLYDGDDKIEEEVIYVEYGNKVVVYRKQELDQLELAYATTIHKSQGGEYKAVILALSSQHYSMSTRNLLYTGMTRAEEFLCIIGPEHTLIKAIKNNKVRERYTGLAERIKRYLELEKEPSFPA